MAEYAPILIFLVVAALFPVATLVIAAILRPSRYNKVKVEAYECGVPPSGEARARYPVRFYILAVLFVIFDVETIFLFPWAVQMRSLLMFGFVEMLVFLGILVIGFAYAWRKGALEWA
ncbi:MAG TPA: NADH-quinone oxidoreductase subunit A [Candidatus Polarisedimenticolia bacterium]|nr:NADH-quinone oxidoreductase subunit A [Candidatus Polarisedimenticolia bacterium]